MICVALDDIKVEGCNMVCAESPASAMASVLTSSLLNHREVIRVAVAKS